MMALLPFSINSPVVLNLRRVDLHRVTRREWSWLPADKSDAPKIQFLRLHIVAIATTASKWHKLFTEEACRSTACWNFCMSRWNCQVHHCWLNVTILVLQRCCFLVFTFSQLSSAQAVESHSLLFLLRDGQKRLRLSVSGHLWYL